MNAKKFGKEAGKTALLGGIGGLVAAGAQMLVEPSIFKTQDAMKKYWWGMPLAEIVLGAVAGGFSKTALAGAGCAGAGVAHAVANANTAIAIKRNERGAAQTSGYDTGAFVLPGANEAGALFGGADFATHVVTSDAGALIMPSARAA